MAVCLNPPPFGLQKGVCAGGYAPAFWGAFWESFLSTKGGMRRGVCAEREQALVPKTAPRCQSGYAQGMRRGMRRDIQKITKHIAQKNYQNLTPTRNQNRTQKTKS